MSSEGREQVPEYRHLFGFRHVSGVPLCPCRDPGNYLRGEQRVDDPLSVRLTCWCGRTVTGRCDDQAELDALTATAREQAVTPDIEARAEGIRRGMDVKQAQAEAALGPWWADGAGVRSMGGMAVVLPHPVSDFIAANGPQTVLDRIADDLLTLDDCLTALLEDHADDCGFCECGRPIDPDGTGCDDRRRALSQFDRLDARYPTGDST